MSLIWKIVISRWILDVSLCRICIHTGARTLARSSRGRPLCRRRGHNAVAHAISSHSSPFSALHEWHGNRLSITHAHSHRDASRKYRLVESRTNASDDTRGGVASVGRCSCSCSPRVLYVPLLWEVEDARPRRRPSPSSLKRATAPRVTHGENYVADDPSTSKLQDQESSPCASHVRQVIK